MWTYLWLEIWCDGRGDITLATFLYVWNASSFSEYSSMAVELLVYGLVSGLIYGRLKKNFLSTYIAIFPSMLLGRIAWGIMQIILWGMQSNKFTWEMFIAGAFLKSVPGIILQLIFIPAMMSVLHLTGILTVHEQTKQKTGKVGAEYGNI